MKHHQWLFACLALVAAGLIAGCGGSDSSSDTSTSSTTPAGSSSTPATEASGQATPDDVYNACIDAVSGTAGSAAQSACARARDAFEQCTTQASNAPEGTAREQAMQACQEAANKATDALNAAP